MRSSSTKLLVNNPPFSDVPPSLVVDSPAFHNGGLMPVRFSADGAGLSPPMSWSGVPTRTESLALIVEDADSPTPEPLVHAIAWNLEPSKRGLQEGELSEKQLGKNSFLQATYLPPDPPPGHGAHQFAFQLFALDCKLDIEGAPGRREMINRMRGHVLATGCLFGKYERE